MNEGIFRQKSIDKVSSPESLNDYVRVASPSIWVLLAGIIIFLLGVLVWGVTGKIDTKVNIGIISSNNESFCYISENDIDKISKGQKFSVEENEYEIDEIENSPIQAKTLSPLIQHALKIDEDAWVYEAKIKGNLPEGEYESSIVTESVSPISFIIN